MTLIIYKQDAFSNAMITDDDFKNLADRNRLYMDCHFNDRVSERTRNHILNIARYLIEADLIEQGEF